jgi:serine/threonine protein phosphatase PrpC
LTVYAANAGDARIVLGHNGKAERMTHDHRTDDPEEVRRIEQAGGFLFKGRVVGVLAVTRSLGDHCMKDFVIAKPFVRELTIQLPEKEGDSPSFLILAW